MPERFPTILPPQPFNDAKLRQLLDDYPVTQTVRYGTAGFRFQADIMPPIMVRVGITAVLRSLQLDHQPVAVMVTASHNDESYNGVKIADPNGGMMAAQGEVLATELANQRDNAVVMKQIQTWRQEYANNNAPTLHVGCDTRSHSQPLLHLVMEAAQAMGCRVVNHGVVTTPMLHHLLLHTNRQYLPLMIPCRPTAPGYVDLLAHSYHALLATREAALASKQPLIVDCACGVGYPHLQALVAKIQALDARHRVIQPVNKPGAGPLNQDCGSEHVQKSLQPPIWYDEPNVNTQYCASLDGDADRIVFFSVVDDKLTLLDGDKMACLIATFLQQEWSALCLGVTDMPPLRLGVVQTAYANGASTGYLQQILGDNVVIAKTGVKHVHHAAVHNFDVGIYFEANGHGTVVFGPKFYQCLSLAETVLMGHSNRANVALQRLSVLPALINQAVGDAFSDLLLIDAILQLRQWTLEDWNAMYQDLPSRQAKLPVQNRSVIQTNDNETICLEPAQVQVQLIEAMQQYKGRAFVRPSGTEDVVRIYAEAPTRPQADALATKAAEIVHQTCHGIGKPPVFGTNE